MSELERAYSTGDAEQKSEVSSATNILQHTCPDPGAGHFPVQFCKGRILQGWLKWWLFWAFLIRSQVVLIRLRQTGNTRHTGKLLWWERYNRRPKAHGAFGLWCLPLCVAIGGGMGRRGKMQNVWLFGNWGWNLKKEFLTVYRCSNNSETWLQVLRN